MVHQLLVPQQEIRTGRLVLTPVTPADIDAVHELFSDARTWTHLPAGRHTSRAQTEDLVQRKIGGRVRYGLGSWVARAADSRAFIGLGGVDRTAGGVWNLGYRLAPEHHGYGYATELARAAVDAARDVRPELPVTGRVLTNNPASARVLARVGLTQVWQGPSAAAGSDDVECQAWSDRELTRDQLDWLIANA
ncbi:GNAT family N-acetyltransferase [Curtobacterium sp. MCBD17_008]|uniref:GNAT family N-acetyltransferase n=1 Tax=Curtobacterium sp. MCBD17_008 TaxID=2175656 RepID=UPI000DA9D716|nr:GNAT family N-acetyltransferase [Curtobacterium sp. MCBD17_008]PZE91765.1 N-acetyltransferase [Curtobacterium sp. MCBD17_008]